MDENSQFSSTIYESSNTEHNDFEKGSFSSMIYQSNNIKHGDLP